MRETGTLIDALVKREDVLACTSWPEAAWNTPDGREWAPQDILSGWGKGGHISDRWACSMIAKWIREKRVIVRYIELPQPLTNHTPDDPAWKFIASFGDRTVREPDSWFGRADLGLFWDPKTHDNDRDLLIEFGTCFPGKFVLNLGSCYVVDWGIVPYHCPYGFVFSAKDIPILSVPESLLPKSMRS